jgi:phospholipid/cholesterol/gamma-HCH transport system substrate-binding protein
MEQLLAHVASLSNSLADKDKVIGSVIDNLTKVLGNVAARDQELSHLVVSLQQFVTGLAQDKDAIFDSLQTVNTLADSTSNLLAQARPPLAADISRLGALSTNLSDSKDVLDKFLQLEPTKLDLITRTAVNGSWFNFFMCGAGGYVVLPGTGSNPADGITVPAGGLSDREPGCGG